MKGLICKDIEILKSNGIWKYFLAVYLLMLFIVGSVDSDAVFFMGTVSLISASVMLASISYDEGDNGMVFLLTLPVSRREYVREKYVFGLVVCGLGWLTAVLFAAVLNYHEYMQKGWDSWLAAAASGAFLTWFYIAIELPLRLKFGYEKSRLANILVIALIFAGQGVFAGVVKLTWKAQEQGDMSACRTPLLTAAVLAAMAAALLFSVWVSERIMEKKEF